VYAWRIDPRVFGAPYSALVEKGGRTGVEAFDPGPISQRPHADPRQAAGRVDVFVHERLQILVQVLDLLPRLEGTLQPDVGADLANDRQAPACGQDGALMDIRRDAERQLDEVIASLFELSYRGRRLERS